MTAPCNIFYRSSSEVEVNAAGPRNSQFAPPVKLKCQLCFPKPDQVVFMPKHNKFFIDRSSDEMAMGFCSSHTEAKGKKCFDGAILKLLPGLSKTYFCGRLGYLPSKSDSTFKYYTFHLIKKKNTASKEKKMKGKSEYKTKPSVSLYFLPSAQRRRQTIDYYGVKVKGAQFSVLIMEHFPAFRWDSKRNKQQLHF